VSGALATVHENPGEIVSPGAVVQRRHILVISYL
jgi:hypothetical protein